MKLVLRLAHLALHEIDNLFRLGHGVVLGHRADNHVAAVKKDHRGGDALRFRIRDDLRFSVSVDVRDGGKGRSQVDSDYVACAHVLKKVEECL